MFGRVGIVRHSPVQTGATLAPTSYVMWDANNVYYSECPYSTPTASCAGLPLVTIHSLWASREPRIPEDRKWHETEEDSRPQILRWLKGLKKFQERGEKEWNRLLYKANGRTTVSFGEDMAQTDKASGRKLQMLITFQYLQPYNLMFPRYYLKHHDVYFNYRLINN